MIDVKAIADLYGKPRSKIEYISTAGPSPTRDWMKRQMKDALDVANALLPQTMREELCNEIAKKEKENNMPTKNAQYYYDLIKEHLRVENVNIREASDRWTNPEIEITGRVPNEVLFDLNTGHRTKIEKLPSFPQCKGIIRRKNTTRVDWKDGTKTIIVLEDGKEDMDMFHTFCIAFTKKMLGSTSEIMRTIEKNDTDKIEKAKKEAEDKKAKQAAEVAKKLREQMEAAAFEKAVQEKLFEERVIEEAIRRYNIREERKMNREDPIESFQVIDVREVKEIEPKEE